MKYYSFNQFNLNKNKKEIVTVSESDIIKFYYPFWTFVKNLQYGKEYVEENFTFGDCIDDWIQTYFAWESKDD